MADVEYQVDDRVALITLNRPDVYNALTAAMGGAVNQALRRADADPGVRCVVITGAGRGFCAGADVSLFTDDAALLKDSDPDEGLRPELLMRLRKPVVAAVNGSAAGVGFVLMACADVRFVAEKATLTTSYARLGVSAEYGIGWLLPRLIGLPNALDLLLSAGKISGAEALRLGLAQRALPAPEVLPAALDYARALASGCAPRALATIKAQVYSSLHRPFVDALAEAEQLMVESFASPDLAEGAAAQAERRQPRFADLEPPADSGYPVQGLN